jgi:hypothetical protein
VLAKDEVLAGEADGLPPFHAEVAPEGVPGVGLIGMAEELELGLLELARAEGEVARRDLVAERLVPVLPMPKGILMRVVSTTFLNCAKMPWAVSGRR